MGLGIWGRISMCTYYYLASCGIALQILLTVNIFCTRYEIFYNQNIKKQSENIICNNMVFCVSTCLYLFVSRKLYINSCTVKVYFDCVYNWFTDKHVNTTICIEFAVYIVVVLGASIIGKEG